MWCLSVAGRMVVHQYLGGGSHLQPLLGWCLILLPPRHPCVMEEEQVLGFSGGVCFPLVCTPLHLASACVWQIHHRLCGFVICDQEPCVCGLGLFGHWHCWSCVLIEVTLVVLQDLEQYKWARLFVKCPKCLLQCYSYLSTSSHFNTLRPGAA